MLKYILVIFSSKNERVILNNQLELLVLLL